MTQLTRHVSETLGAHHALMDQRLNLPEPQAAASEPAPYRGYDTAALGVECAWPVAEREALIAH